MSSVKETNEPNTVTAVDVQASTKPSEAIGEGNGDRVTATSSDVSVPPQAAAVRNQQAYYTYQNHTIANSPASSQNGGYDIHSLLAQQVPSNSSFGHQYINNLVPPLSPAGRENNNNGEPGLPPASPLFPGTTMPLYNTTSDQHDSNVLNAPSMFASTTSPTFQYLSGPPPSPIVSYGYPPSIPNSPDHRNAWNER